MGLYLGIGGVATFKKSRLLDILHAIPLDRGVLETDCPYLAPEPGQNSEPADVARTAAYAAELWQCTSTEVCERNSANFRALFGEP